MLWSLCVAPVPRSDSDYTCRLGYMSCLSAHPKQAPSTQGAVHTTVDVKCYMEVIHHTCFAKLRWCRTAGTFRNHMNVLVCCWQFNWEDGSPSIFCTYFKCSGSRQELTLDDQTGHRLLWDRQTFTFAATGNLESSVHPLSCFLCAFFPVITLNYHGTLHFVIINRWYGLWNSQIHLKGKCKEMVLM